MYTRHDDDYDDDDDDDPLPSSSQTDASCARRRSAGPRKIALIAAAPRAIEHRVRRARGGPPPPSSSSWCRRPSPTFTRRWRWRRPRRWGGGPWQLGGRWLKMIQPPGKETPRTAATPLTRIFPRSPPRRTRRRCCPSRIASFYRSPRTDARMRSPIASGGPSTRLRGRSSRWSSPRTRVRPRRPPRRPPPSICRIACDTLLSRMSAEIDCLSPSHCEWIASFGGGDKISENLRAIDFGINSTYLHAHMPKINSSSVKICESSHKVLAQFSPSSRPLLAQKFSIVTRRSIIYSHP